jgi:hypothetical protein
MPWGFLPEAIKREVRREQSIVAEKLVEFWRWQSEMIDKK